MLVKQLSSKEFAKKYHQVSSPIEKIPNIFEFLFRENPENKLGYCFHQNGESIVYAGYLTALFNQEARRAFLQNQYIKCGPIFPVSPAADTVTYVRVYVTGTKDCHACEKVQAAFANAVINKILDDGIVLDAHPYSQIPVYIVSKGTYQRAFPLAPFIRQHFDKRDQYEWSLVSSFMPFPDPKQGCVQLNVGLVAVKK